MEAAKLKQRIVGAVVLVSLAVIVLPMMLGGRDEPGLHESLIPPKPERAASAPVIEQDARQHEAEPALAEPERRIVEAPLPPPPAPAAAPAPAASVAAPPVAPEPPLPAASEMQSAVGSWVVQVGSFGKEDNALALRDKLRKAGHSAFVEAVRHEGEQVYRVRVGPEIDRERAEKLRERLAREQQLNGMVLRHR